MQRDGGEEECEPPHQHENAFVEDELWENQKREGANWVPALSERGMFSDRFCRFRYNSLADAQAAAAAAGPSPLVGKIGEFQVSGDWQYGKTFTQLEAMLAKGGQPAGQSSLSQCRWRRWTRKRELLRASNEICVGWLGTKARGGTWKSRFFVLVKRQPATAASTPTSQQFGGGAQSSSTALAATSAADFAELDEEELSSDDEEEEEEAQGAGGATGAAKTPSLAASSTNSLLANVEPLSSPEYGASTPSQQQQQHQHQQLFRGEEQAHSSAMFFYLRRGFDDPRCAFPTLFDWNELKRLPKKYINHIKLPSRGMHRVDDTQPDFSTTGRFALRFASGRRRVYNANCTEARERWVEALRDMLGENDAEHGQNKRHGGRLVSAALHAAKRSQQAMSFSLRRSSSNGMILSHAPMADFSRQHSAPMPGTSQGKQQSPSMQVRSLQTPSPPAPATLMVVETVELMRDPLSGALNIQVSDEGVPGRLVVMDIFDNCREFPSGAYPTNLFVGDCILSVQGENLVHSPSGGGGSATALTRFKEIVRKARTVTLQVQRASSPPAAALKTKSSPLRVITNSDDSECDEALMLFQQQPLQRVSPPTMASRPPFLGEQVLMGNNNSSSSEGGVASTTPLTMLPPPMLRCCAKRTEVPPNALGLQSAQVRAACLKKLEEAFTTPAGGGNLTYAQLRAEVGKHLQVGTLFDCDEWRLFFRDFLDYWVCDGVRYSTGGLDLVDFTPVILKID